MSQLSGGSLILSTLYRSVICRGNGAELPLICGSGGIKRTRTGATAHHLAGRGARLPICFPVCVRASSRPRPSLPLGLLRV